MRNQTKISILLLTAIVGLCGCGKSYEQSEALTHFISENQRSTQTLYFYPSTIRMLGGVMNAENSQAFADIESGRFVFTWDHEKIDIAEHFDGILSEAKDEGFEMLAEMNTADSRMLIYLNDESGSPGYLILLQNSFGDFIIEMVGQLSMQSITSLSQLDFTDVASTFGLNKVDETMEEEIGSQNEQEETD